MMQKGPKPLTPRVMLGWGLWVFRSPVYSPRKLEVFFGYHNKGYSIVLLGAYVRR